MDLILCHITADFDALGSAVGLAKLLPGARIVLTGGAHPAVRDFLALHRDEYPLIEQRSVNPKQIRSLHVVDAQSRARFGTAALWFDLPQVKTIAIYDHHGQAVCDIPATTLQIEPVGATATLIAERLQEQDLAITRWDATVLALGIHGDTGSLTFDHTTPRDAAALAWLMAQGAMVRAIAEYLDPGFSPELQALLPRALECLQTELVQGYQIAWVVLDVEAYVPGLSSLASQLLEVTESDALLLVVQFPGKGLGKGPNQGGEGRITVIGRSQISGTDLGDVFRAQGGGGHGKAASLSLRGVSVDGLLAQLLEELRLQIPAPLLAEDLMSSPVRTIRPQTTILEAQRILLRYGHSGLSVVDDLGRLVGIISRRDLDLALHHGFGHAPVKGYMTLNPRTIRPTTPLPEIERLMLTYDIGRLPVVAEADAQLLGIVTRTDVLRANWGLNGGVSGEHVEWRAGGVDPEDPSMDPPVDLLADPLADARGLSSSPRLAVGCRGGVLQGWWQRLGDRLIPALGELLNCAAALAEQRGWHLYLVGGGVRDLLLQDASGGECHPVALQDIDLVVDGVHRAVESGAGVALAQALQRQYPAARLDVHGKFQTAALLWHNDGELGSLWVDIATARTEFYPYPAANPEVEASSIRQDLYRRDFTINALALRLTQPHRGELLDFFGGVLDLQERWVRVLHVNSFIEDPTRIYRAVRFAVRLGFRIEPQTEQLIAYALGSGVYERTQGENLVTPALQTRLRAELELILEAGYWQRALKVLGELDALQCLHRDLHLTSQIWRRIRLLNWMVHGVAQSATMAPLVSWLARLEGLIAELPDGERGRVAKKLQLPWESCDRLAQLAQVQLEIQQQLAPQLSPDLNPSVNPGGGQLRPSQIYGVLRDYDRLTLLLVAARSDRRLRRVIWQYLSVWMSLQSPINGHDLKTFGYQPGRQFKLILEAVMAAYLDGEFGDLHTMDFTIKSAIQAWVGDHFPLSCME